jgi:hypothetical protein
MFVRNTLTFTALSIEEPAASRTAERFFKACSYDRVRTGGKRERGRRAVRSATLPSTIFFVVGSTPMEPEQ